MYTKEDIELCIVHYEIELPFIFPSKSLIHLLIYFKRGFMHFRKNLLQYENEMAKILPFENSKIFSHLKCEISLSIWQKILPFANGKIFEIKYPPEEVFLS